MGSLGGVRPKVAWIRPIVLCSGSRPRRGLVGRKNSDRKLNPFQRGGKGKKKKSCGPTQKVRRGTGKHWPALWTERTREQTHWLTTREYCHSQAK